MVSPLLVRGELPWSPILSSWWTGMMPELFTNPPNLGLLCPRTASLDRRLIVVIASTHLFTLTLVVPTPCLDEPQGLLGLFRMM